MRAVIFSSFNLILMAFVLVPSTQASKLSKLNSVNFTLSGTQNYKSKEIRATDSNSIILHSQKVKITFLESMQNRYAGPVAMVKSIEAHKKSLRSSINMGQIMVGDHLGNLYKFENKKQVSFNIWLPERSRFLKIDIQCAKKEKKECLSVLENIKKSYWHPPMNNYIASLSGVNMWIPNSFKPMSGFKVSDVMVQTYNMYGSMDVRYPFMNLTRQKLQTIVENPGEYAGHHFKEMGKAYGLKMSQIKLKEVRRGDVIQFEMTGIGKSSSGLPLHIYMSMALLQERQSRTAQVITLLGGATPLYSSNLFGVFYKVSRSISAHSQKRSLASVKPSRSSSKN